ncbi:GNAT family N-acetyltransferase [Paractinoplanes globisporus]|uniref:GNAT family N-acetyltransferase n=1 Tax=Paractinoplanes globisporus TaxID=113565 RepID=A0ABW6WJ54_9ACTN|nr:GNAT family N-acetyltransferase [Actinoplanes globisporus]
MTLIRPLTDADIDAVAAVHVRTWQAAYAGIVPDDFLSRLDPAVRARDWRTRPRTPGSQTLVAVKDTNIIGFVTYGPDRDDPSAGELYAIYVDPGHWGGGAGRLLLTAARDGLAASNFPEMRLWVLTGNAEARSFYEHLGLTPDGAAQTWTPRGTEVELPELRYATAL